MQPPVTPAQAWDIGKLLPQLSVGAGIAGVVIRALILRSRNKGQAEAKQKGLQLDGLISAFYTAAAVPGALFLVACSFRPDWIKFLSDLYLALAAAGLAILYLAYRQLIAD
jgi:hypothetical protein